MQVGFGMHFFNILYIPHPFKSDGSKQLLDVDLRDAENWQSGVFGQELWLRGLFYKQLPNTPRL